MLKTNLTTQTVNGQAQETQTKTIEFVLPAGPTWNDQTNEYDIWDNGQIIGYHRDEDEAWDIYHEALATQRTHLERCPDDAVLWRRTGEESYVDKAPVEPAAGLGDHLIVIHSAGGLTTVTRDGVMEFEEA